MGSVIDILWVQKMIIFQKKHQTYFILFEHEIVFYNKILKLSIIVLLI
jgi:hypothetical protein